jgi:hypothetical protein
LVEQIELENQNIAYTSPYVRLIYSVVSSAMKCHGINTMLDNRMKMLEKRQEGEDEEVKEEEKVDDDVVEEETVDEEGKEVEREKSKGLTFDDDE